MTSKSYKDAEYPIMSEEEASLTPTHPFLPPSSPLLRRHVQAGSNSPLLRQPRARPAGWRCYGREAPSYANSGLHSQGLLQDGADEGGP